MTEPYLPTDVVFHPNWWHQNYDLSFDREFFYNPERRVWQEQRMRQLLYDRFGDLGLGQKDAPRRPIIGPILMGSGYIIQEILGCEVNYQESGNPWVLPRKLTEAEVRALAVPEDIERTPSMQSLLALMADLEAEFGYLQGDVPLHSVVNVAIDLRGQDYFIDLIQQPELVAHLHTVIARTVYEVGRRVKARTGNVSISINRSIASFDPSIFTISKLLAANDLAPNVRAAIAGTRCLAGATTAAAWLPPLRRQRPPFCSALCPGRGCLSGRGLGVRHCGLPGRSARGLAQPADEPGQDAHRHTRTGYRRCGIVAPGARRAVGQGGRLLHQHGLRHAR